MPKNNPAVGMCPAGLLLKVTKNTPAPSRAIKKLHTHPPMDLL